MTFFQFLQTIIATVFVFLTLSLVASEILEAYSNRFRVRAKKLEQSIASLFGEKFKNRLYGQESFLQKISHEKASKVSGGPSYINASDFSKAVMILLQEKLDGEIGTQTLLDHIINENETSTDYPEAQKTLQDLVKATQYGQYSKEISSDKDKDKKLRLEIESLFISAQERITGDYKRWSQIHLFFIGVIIAFIANADTVHIISEFSENPLQSQALVEAIDNVVDPEDSLKDISVEVKEIFEDPSRELPLFWQPENGSWKLELREGQEWRWAPLGWFLTAFAILMGAPFWFDLLNKLFEIRSTMKPVNRSSSNKKEG